MGGKCACFLLICFTGPAPNWSSSSSSSSPCPIQTVDSSLPSRHRPALHPRARPIWSNIFCKAEQKKKEMLRIRGVRGWLRIGYSASSCNSAEVCKSDTDFIHLFCGNEYWLLFSDIFLWVFQPDSETSCFVGQYVPFLWFPLTALLLGPCFLSVSLVLERLSFDCRFICVFKLLQGLVLVF